jgi:uncharacterized protein YegP (UPF0339 family)
MATTKIAGRNKMRQCKFEIYESKGQWYFRFKSTNGRIICHSEGYTRKSKAQKAVGIVQDRASEANVLDLS